MVLDDNFSLERLNIHLRGELVVTKLTALVKGTSSSQFVTHEQLASTAAAAATAVLKQQELFGSYKTATIIGKAILEGVPQDMTPFHSWLPPLNAPLLHQLLTDVEAQQAWAQLQQKRLAASMPGGKLVVSDVQLFYEVLLRRLRSLSNRDDLYVLPTSQGGIGRKKPDICISASPLKAAVALVYAAELQKLLHNTTSRQGAASQYLERVRLILANQQNRSRCYALAGGADAIKLWRYSGVQPDACSNLLLLSWEADVSALQALVRLWSMTLEQIGYVPASLPIVQDESAMLDDVKLLTTTSSRDANMEPLPGTTVLQGKWKGRTVVAKTSRQIDDEEEALIATQHVEGIVKLVETVMSGNTKWLIMEPVGVELPLSPASVVLTHMDELAQCVERLYGVGWLHCDISFFNCLVFQPEVKAGLIDMGAAKTIRQAAKDGGGWATGTPQFMSLSLLLDGTRNLSTELESLMYVFLYIATGARLVWKPYRIEQREARAVKMMSMTLAFRGDVLSKIEDPVFSAAAINLQRLFFPSNQLCRNVTVQAFRQALAGARAVYGIPK